MSRRWIVDSLKAFRDKFHVPLEDDQLADLPFIRPPAGSPEELFIKERREALGGPVPYRETDHNSLPAPPLEYF